MSNAIMSSLPDTTHTPSTTQTPCTKPTPSTLTFALTQDTEWQQHATWQMPSTPFMRFAYWQALSDTGAIGAEAGWYPLYGLVIDGSHIVAVMPLFIRTDHHGEYVFDQMWAEAYARYGADYYPRLVTSVPYTPVTGDRVWLAEGTTLDQHIWQTLLAGVDDLARQIKASSWHGLFVPSAMVELATNTDAMPNDLIPNDAVPCAANTSPNTLVRQGCQFIWHNCHLAKGDQPFVDFEDFASTLTARKRKNIRQERQKIAKQHLTCRIKTGDDITEDDWQTFYQCYAMTYLVRGRSPYLSPEFFTQIAKTMPQHLMLAQALDGKQDDQVVASSLFFYDDPSQPDATLYGRYWGALGEYDCLHFELCYYQGIEFAIAQGLAYFDPGTQGEHKLIRGFVPTPTHSLHRIYDDRFVPAISDFCAQDRAYMQAYRKQAHEALPFNADNMPEFGG